MPVEVGEIAVLIRTFSRPTLSSAKIKLQCCLDHPRSESVLGLGLVTLPVAGISYRA
jgi:hypothetical protein